ncbi:MAG TPA: peroxiredoxin [Chthoniobacterales bacterium]
MSIALKLGDAAPDFAASVIGGEYGEGKTVQLSGFRGREVVLYFYPKDDTPGCATQACGIRDKWEKLRGSDALVFGISTDSLASHRKFIEKFSLPFPLISDEDKSIVNAYGVWVEKSMYGKKFMGTERSTFIIRPDGTIKGIFRKVVPGEHVDTLLEELGVS